jgi:Fe-S oxidoreductase
VLIGAAGAGKSTFAARHFAPDEVLSSDRFRRIVSGDEANQAATKAAFVVLHEALRRRLAKRRTAVVDDTFASFMDLCLVCRACEDVCPSHVPFGRMMERARVQVEPLRSRRARFLRWLGLDVALLHPAVLLIATFFQPIARPFLTRRMRALTPRHTSPFARLPRVTEPPTGRMRGDGRRPLRCRDRWFHEVNLATIRVLARNGWRVVAERSAAAERSPHNGRLDTARTSRAVTRAFAESTTLS